TDSNQGLGPDWPIYFLNPHEGWFLSPSFELLHTTDSGAHWLRLGTLATGPNPHATSLVFTDSRTGYLLVRPASVLAGQPGVWNLLITRDGGGSWKPQSPPRPRGLNARAEIGNAVVSFFNAQDGVLELDYCTGGCGKGSA